ncbi:breast cancer type 2 susceptibility protein isoform X2 [Festucalex cinctus]
MYDYLTEEIWKELGQVDPDWFEVLTTRASSKEGNISDSDDQEEICPNQEANVKTPLRKTAAPNVAESQTPSTPQVFRPSYVASPENEDQQENEMLPWGGRSPCLFGLSKDTVPLSNYGDARPRTSNWFDLLDTPQVSPASYAQHIAESLGANINPDISWTSSLNTPPALPSTLILSEPDESPSPMTFPMDKSAVLVRKLFPSLSNNSRKGVVSPRSNDPLVVVQDADLQSAVPHPMSQKSPQRSPEQISGIWRQQLADASEDRAICSPVVSVPDCTENSPPMFFNSSSSLLRKVESERTKRRQGVHNSSPSNVSIESKTLFSEQAESDQERHVNPAVETEGNGLSQWSPLSLSDIPATTVATLVEDKCTTQVESECHSGYPVKPSLNFAGFTKKKTKFIYTIDKQKHSLKNNSTDNWTEGEKLPVMLMPKADDGADVCNISDEKEELHQQEDVAKENLPALLRVNSQDLDMSQLCRAFAQDFSQMPYSGAPPKMGPPPPPPRSFSPVACLAALKVARQKAKRQVEVHREASSSESVDEVAASDSGFLSGGADVSQVAVSCIEKLEPSHNSTVEFTSTKQNEVCLEEISIGTFSDAEDTAKHPQRSLKDLTCPLVSVQSDDCERTQEIVAGSLPSTHVSGFKTASNKSIQISAGWHLQKAEPHFDESDSQQLIKFVNDKEIPTLDSAASHPGTGSKKCLWKDSDESNRHTEESLQGFSWSLKQAENAPESPRNMNTGTCQGEQAFKCNRDTRKDIPATSASAPWTQNCEQANYQLTASQKADVKELCTLLEEAGSQFEFTQFRTLKSKEGSAPLPKADKDLNPDLLSGIDFDDSFCAEANEKTTSESCDQTNLEEPGVAKQALLAHIIKTEEMITGRVQTAEESVERVPKKCLRKTKHLCQDLEEATPAHKRSVQNSRDTLHESTSQNADHFTDSYNTEEPLQGFSSSVQPNQRTPRNPGNMISCAHQNGFHLASGKTIFISPRALQTANAVFKDCARENGQLLVGIEPFMNAASSSSSASLNLVSSLDGSSESSAAKHRLQEDHGNKPSAEIKPGSSSLLKCVDHQPGGFQTAAGKRVAVSSTALQKAKVLLDDCFEVKERQARYPPARKSELLTASEKPGSFSDNSLFGNLDSTSEHPSVSGVKAYDAKRGNDTNVEKMDGCNSRFENENVQNYNNVENQANPSLDVGSTSLSVCGFSTATGKKLCVSATALKKAKQLLQEDHGDDLSSKMKHGSFLGVERVDLTARGKKVAACSAALTKANFLLKDCDSVEEHGSSYSPLKKSNFLSATKEPVSFTDTSDIGFTSEGPALKTCAAKPETTTNVHKMDCPNTNSAPFVKNKNLWHQNNLESHENPSLDVSPSGSGFCTASGKKVSVSNAAMAKAKHLLQEDRKDQSHRKGSFLGVAPVNHQTGGFLTAGGKQVVVSSAALKNAKSLLDCDSDEEHSAFCPPVRRKSKFLSTSEKSFSENSFFDNLCSTSESPIMKLDEAKQGNPASKEKSDGCVLIGDTTKKNTILPNMTTQEADCYFKDMINSNDGMSGNESPSLSGLKARNMELNGQNYPLQNKNLQHLNNRENHGNPSLDFGSSSLSGVGFSTASVNKVSVSAASMAKAKQLFQEEHKDDVSTKTKHGSFSLVERVKQQPGGFQTAAGKRVAVSSAALKKAKFLLDDCDSAEEHSSYYPPSGKSEFLSASVKRGSFSDNSLFDKLCSTSDSPAVGLDVAKQRNTTCKEKSDSCSSLEGVLQKKTSLAKEITQETDDYDKDEMDSNDRTNMVEIMSKVKFRNANAAPFVDAKNERHHTSLETRAVSTLGICSSSPSGSGFCTASGKYVSVSDEAMTRAKSLLSDVESENQKFHHSTSLPNDKQDSVQNVAFQTAGGRRGSLPPTALKKSNSFLIESREHTTDVPHTSTSSSCAFSTASGKKVLVSDNAMAKAKSLLDESVMDTDASSLSFAAKKKANNLQIEERADDKSVKSSKISNCGFNAASGKPVSFSTEALHKAKALFDDIGLDEDVQTSAQNITFNVPSMSGFAQGQRGKNQAAVEETTQEKGDIHGQEMPDVFGEEMNRPPEEAAIVNLQSFDLTDCTETQQLFLAQEALDCTKALLEDESLAGPSMTMENMPPNKDSRGPEEEQTHGKRSSEGLPPPKRRLLDEFDRSRDSSGASKFCPQTSSPNGLIKDRAAFKYNVSLGPNITRPHRDGMGYVEAVASPRTNRQPSPVGLTFLPPFFKKTDVQPRRSNTKIPSAFVPPFKSQTAAEQSSIKHLNSNTKKMTQNSEDPQTTSADQFMTNHITSPSPPFDNCLIQGTTLDNVELARDMQEMRIRKKTRQIIRPLPGSLFQAKTSGATRIPLKDAVACRLPAKYTQKQLYEYGVHRHVCKITSETAEAFRFQLELFFKKEAFADEGGVQLADGGRLIPCRDGTAGKEQFYRALCDTPGVDPKLLSDEWVYNHYRWVVWKLASMERSFPETMGGLCLTPERVLLQLKYRYDVEVDHSRRPALRKIMEKDDTAAKTLVLCMCGVLSQGQAGSPCAVVWLTDGWYSVKAQLDEPLSGLLRKGRLAAGRKLVIHGAQLVGSQDACAPLEAPQSLMLKIFANSCRPARWDAKLGFYRDPRPFLLPLSSLYSNGGPVGCVDVVVLRSYPVQWMERKSDGGVVFRSARAEEKEEARYNSHRQKAMEALYAKIQEEFEQEVKDSKRQLRRRTVSHRDIAGLQDGQELYEAVGDDLAGVEADLSDLQLETLQAYRRSLMDKKQAEMQHRYRRATQKRADDDQASCPQRDVTPVWRLCVADSLNPTGDVYQLNIWRPSSDMQALLKEGCRYKVYNLATSDRKKRGGVAALQLTATKKTQFQDLQTSPEWLSAFFQPRVSTDFVALQNLQFDPPCGEVDLAGCVVSVVDAQGPSPAFYLADGNVNFVKVRCFSSLLQAGLADVVKAGALLALSNLQLRGQYTRPTPVVYAGDLTVFSSNPKEEHHQKALGHLRNLLRVGLTGARKDWMGKMAKQERENFFVCSEDKLSQVLKCDGWSSVSSPNLPPKTPPMQHIKLNTASQQPIRSLGCFTPPTRNLQSPANASSSEKDPRSLRRRRVADYLSRMPSPPPLFLPPGLAASPSVKKTFNPPRRASAPHTLKSVHTPTLAPVAEKSPPEEKDDDEWVDDNELAMIDTQALRVNHAL